jgi:DNA transformation protein
MAKDEGFRTFVEDQLRGLEGLAIRPMFGGYGLYRRGVFFGIISRGQLYFKTDETTRRTYQQAGMRPFRPNARQTLKSYYGVPAQVLEDADRLAGGPGRRAPAGAIGARVMPRSRGAARGLASGTGGGAGGGVAGA